MQVFLQILAIFAVLVFVKFVVLGVLDTLRAVMKFQKRVITATWKGALIGAVYGLLAATQRAEASVMLYALGGAFCVALGQVYAALFVAMHRKDQWAVNVFRTLLFRKSFV